MNIRITDLEEKFVFYYTSEDYINIFLPLTSEETDEKTIDEFIKCASPCKECLIQSMCIKDRIYIDSNKRYRGISLKICEKLKEFISKNRPLFFPVKLQKNTFCTY